MKKKELIFTVMDVIRGSEATNDSGKFVHPQDVEFQLSIAYDQTVKDFFNLPKNMVNYDLDYFTKDYIQKVKKDTKGNLYVDIPINPIALNNGQGIRRLRPEDSFTTIVRTTESTFMSLLHLESFALSPWAFCFVDFPNKKIILQGNRPEYDILSNVSLKLIPQFIDFDLSDEINTPDGDYNLSQMVLKNMGIRPTDNTNDDGK